ncbi:MAG TPA: transcription termination factor NusA [Anaerolineaceae bacterium]|nr:transcription termination factor NusA [Anaerolineaceae bacterium]HOH20237.1 transcription termination factor NusA [Anaerolineaceae bacterium]HOU44446.1 transcription termination factor NusA [Anaerolineaceae bacterium]HQF45652.1 transcription termination factor NusA [Anaerolineaceae bacterium]
MKNEFTLAFNEVLEEKGLPREVILHALELAMASAYRKAVNASQNQHVEAKVDMDTGKVTIFTEKEVVESVESPITEVSLEDALLVDPDAELGGMVIVESTPADFGRVAAQTARQVIQQRIREAERQAQLDHFRKQVGEIINGVVQAVNSQGLTIGLDMKAEGSMPRKEMIPNERFKNHDRVRALLAEVNDNPRGPQIILSRTHRNFLRRLLETEVPEIYHGVVEIRSIAREPGERAKVAVSATQPGIDPVGACVGIKGVRIQAIVKELSNEKIDVIEWNADPAIFIAKAISPARVTGVYLNDRAPGGKTATVIVPEDQLSLAIGRDGQNARLAAKLTGWRIDIKSVSEAGSETLQLVRSDSALLEQIGEELLQTIQDLLVRKSEGRPLSAEEYDKIAKFIDRVERRLVAARTPEKQAEPEKPIILEGIPASAYETNILDSGLPEHVAYILQEGGYNTVAELATEMRTEPDNILRLNGIGQKAMQTIRNLMETLEQQAAAEAETAKLAEQAPAEEIPAALEETPAAAVEEAVAAVEPVEVEAGIVETVPGEPVAEEVVPEEEPSLEEIFTLRPEVLTATEYVDEEEEEGEGDKKDRKKPKGKKGRRFVNVEYDPDKDVTIVRKQHKRGDDEWSF